MTGQLRRNLTPQRTGQRRVARAVCCSVVCCSLLPSSSLCRSASPAPCADHCYLAATRQRTAQPRPSSQRRSGADAKQPVWESGSASTDWPTPSCQQRTRSAARHRPHSGNVAPPARDCSAHTAERHTHTALGTALLIATDSNTPRFHSQPIPACLSHKLALDSLCSPPRNGQHARRRVGSKQAR